MVARMDLVVTTLSLQLCAKFRTHHGWKHEKKVRRQTAPRCLSRSQGSMMCLLIRHASCSESLQSEMQVFAHDRSKGAVFKT